MYRRRTHRMLSQADARTTFPPVSRRTSVLDSPRRSRTTVQSSPRRCPRTRRRSQKVGCHGHHLIRGQMGKCDTSGYFSRSTAGGRRLGSCPPLASPPRASCCRPLGNVATREFTSTPGNAPRTGECPDHAALTPGCLPPRTWYPDMSWRLIHAGGRSRSGPHWPTAGAAAASRGPFLGPVPRRRTKQTNPIRYGLLVFVSVLNPPFSPLLSG